MFRDQVVRDAANLFHFRSNSAAFVQNLQIRCCTARAVRLEQTHHHLGTAERVDPGQRRCHGNVIIYQNRKEHFGK